MEEKERVLQEETNATIAGKRLTDFIIPLAEFGRSEQAQVQNNVRQYCYLSGCGQTESTVCFLSGLVRDL